MGRDVTAYFIIGRLRENSRQTTKTGGLNDGGHIEMCYNVRSIQEAG